MLKLKNKIKSILFVLCISQGKIWIIARPFRRRTNPWKRCGCMIVNEEAAIRLQIPRISWLMTKSWTFLSPPMCLRMGSSPICPLYFHSPVHITNNPYYLGIKYQIKREFFEVCVVWKTILHGSIKVWVYTVRWDYDFHKTWYIMSMWFYLRASYNLHTIFYKRIELKYCTIFDSQMNEKNQNIRIEFLYCTTVYVNTHTRNICVRSYVSPYWCGTLY